MIRFGPHLMGNSRLRDWTHSLSIPSAGTSIIRLREALNRPEYHDRAGLTLPLIIGSKERAISSDAVVEDLPAVGRAESRKPQHDGPGFQAMLISAKMIRRFARHDRQ
jgi:hypothetical protein